MSKKPILIILVNTNSVNEIIIWIQISVTFPQPVLPKPVKSRDTLNEQRWKKMWEKKNVQTSSSSNC